MRRYAILLAMMLLCLPVRGEAWQVVGGGEVQSGPVYTDCSNIGTAGFYWTGDHSSGTAYACKTSSTTILCSWTTATAVDSSSDPGNESPESGGYVGKSTTGASSLQCPVTSNDIFNQSEGRLSVDVYLGASTGVNQIIRVTSGDDEFQAYIQADNKINIVYRGNGGTVTTSLISTATVPDTTWTNIQIRWSVSNNKLSVKVGDGDWLDDSDSDAMTAWSASPAVIRWYNYQTANPFYMDNKYIYTSSGL